MLVDTVHTVPLLQCNIYWLQTKFAKVMFLHLSFCSRGGGGSTWAGTSLGKYTPTRYTLLGSKPPRAGTSPGRYTPRQMHPLSRYTSPAGTPSPRQVHPRAGTPPAGTPPAGTPPAGTPPAGTPPGAVHAGRYGQQAGGTHPTGMQSCVKKYYILVHVRY